jgi:hypothetical protein
MWGNSQSGSKISFFCMTRLRKILKILLTLLAAIVVIYIAFFFITPHFGKVTPKADRTIRSVKLRLYHKKVESFIKENKRLPESLFESLQKELEKEGWCISPKVTGFPDEFKRDPFLGTGDRNSFEKIIEYGFFSGGQRGWFIRELKPGKIYTKMLMIDQDGKIYKLEEIPPPFKDRDKDKNERK